MSDDRDSLTLAGRRVGRRELLAGLAGIGGLGALTGAGTAALLRERELFDGAFSAGALDLVVSWRSLDDRGTSDGRATLSTHGGGRDGRWTDGRDGKGGTGGTDDWWTDGKGGEGGTESVGRALVTLTLPDGDGRNPGYLWMRAACPADGGDLADLDVEVWYADASGATLGTAPILSGSLADAVGAGSTPLDAAAGSGTERACLAPGETRHLLVTWTFSGREATTLDFDFAALQCRHDDGTTDPFGGAPPADCDENGTRPKRYAISHIELYIMKHGTCTYLGKLDDVDGDLDVGATYPIGDRDGGQTGYDLRVTDTEEKDGREVVAVAFEVRAERGPDPELCEVRIKGGRVTVSYGPAGLDENATDGLLSAPEKDAGRDYGWSS